MKKFQISKGKVILAIIGVIAVCAAGVLLNMFLRSNRVQNEVNQQNYVAAKLIELGDYEPGRKLAAKCEQLKKNSVSEELLVLAAGFQSDFEGGLRYAEAYLSKGQDEILEEAKAVFENFLEAEDGLSKEDRTEYDAQCTELKEKSRKQFLELLLRVQNRISLKKNDENMQAVLSLMSTQETGIGSADMEFLEVSNSELSRKIKTSVEMRSGDYEKAYEDAEELFRKNGSFENRAMLANMVAEYGANIGAQDEKAVAVYTEISDLNGRLYSLEDSYNQAAPGAEQLKVEREMESVRSEIQTKEMQVKANPVRKAINFIETTTPIRERSTAAYKIELSKLYYEAGENGKAKKLLMELLENEDTNREPAALLFEDFIRFFYMENHPEERPGYLDKDSLNAEIIWERISDLLGFAEYMNYYDTEGTFYSFVRGILNEFYNGLIIRDIDATEFPTVRVTVNVAMEVDEKLEKGNFSLQEMGIPLSDFTLLDTKKEGAQEELSVVLVVDKSGSMGGSPMEDTKKAVANFVKIADEKVRMGLVAFDNSAQLVTPITDQRSSLRQGIASIESDGGTSIYSGLEVAGRELEREGGKRIIILLSDGEDGDTGMIDAVLDDLKRKNIYVYTIGFGGADTEYLSYIANRCSGKFIQADSSKMLEEIYAAIGEYMTNDYVLEYVVEVEPDNYMRIVKVTVDVNNAFAEEPYNVGVPYDKILEELNEKPLADYFRQVGGSSMDAE